MAIALIKECVKEKINILTGQGAINHALDFIENTNNQIKEEFNEDMQQVIEQDNVESTVINDAIQNSQEIQSHGSSAIAAYDESFLSLSSSTNVKAAEELSENDHSEGTNIDDQEDKEQ
jgi:hypothetical protein